MKTKPKSIDDYLASLNAPERTALEALRKSIRAAAPQAAEGIRYSMPAFRLNGRMLVYFRAAKKHCSFFRVPSRWWLARKKSKAMTPAKARSGFPPKSRFRLLSCENS